MTFTFTQAAPGDSVVRAYVLKHLLDNRLPLDTQPAAAQWVAVLGEDQRVYGVFGWRMVAPTTAEVTDFYFYPNRYGVLAAYEALKRIRDEAQTRGIAVMTLTPPENTAMINAYKKVFGVDKPVLVAYRFDPKSTPTLVMPDGTVEESEVT